MLFRFELLNSRPGGSVSRNLSCLLYHLCDMKYEAVLLRHRVVEILRSNGRPEGGLARCWNTRILLSYEELHTTISTA